MVRVYQLERPAVPDVREVWYVKIQESYLLIPSVRKNTFLFKMKSIFAGLLPHMPPPPHGDATADTCHDALQSMQGEADQ